MKKNCIIGVIVLLMMLSACGGGQTAGNKAVSSNASSVEQVMEAAVTGAAAPADTAVLTDSDAPAAPDDSGPAADVDLTLLSSTMVYSEVSQMLYSPDEYMGKTVKMSGAFAIYEGDTRNYYACIISDATACCANGIEFDWAGDHTYPEDYPELGSEITVTGTFDMYEEDGYMYIQLSDAAVSF